jgi:hypothetical protein
MNCRNLSKFYSVHYCSVVYNDELAVQENGGIFLSDSLEIRIEKTREKMISAAINEGFHSNNTVELSKKLDQLMNDFESKKCGEQQDTHPII